MYLSTGSLQHQKQIGWKFVVRVLDHQVAGDAADVTHGHAGDQIDVVGQMMQVFESGLGRVLLKGLHRCG